MDISDIIIVVLLFIGFFVLPGFLLGLMTRITNKMEELLGLSLPLSFVLYWILSLPGYWLGYSLWVHFGLIILFVITGITQIISKKQKPFINNPWFLFISISGLLCFCASLCSGWSPRGDAAIHIQAVQNMAYDGYFTHPYYSLIPKSIITDHCYDIYYPILALIYKLTQVSLPKIWHYLGGSFSLVVPFSIYTFSFRLTKNHLFSCITIIGFFVVSLFFSEVMYGSSIDYMQYPNRIYFWFVLPHLIWLTFEFVETKNKLIAIILSLLLMTMIFLHQEGFVMYFVIMFLVAIITLFKGQYDGVKIPVVLTCLFLLSIPFLILKQHGNIAFIGLTNTKIWQAHYHIVYYSDKFFAFPYQNYYTPIVVSMCMMTLAGLFHYKNTGLDPKVKYLITASFLVPIVFVFNPVVVPFLSKYGSFVLVNRLMRAPLFFLSASVFLYLVYQNFSESRLRYVLIAFVCCLFIFKIYRLYASFGIKHQDLSIIEILNFIPKNSRIASDPLTSADLAMYRKTQHLTMKFNGAIDLVDIKKEKEIYSHVLVDTNINAQLKFYQEKGIDFIVLNNLKHPEIHPIKDKKIFSNGLYDIYKLK